MTTRRTLGGMSFRGPLLLASLASLALGCALDPEIDTLFGPSNTFAVRPPGGSSSSSSSSSSASSSSSGGGAGGEGEGGASTSSSSSSSSSGTGGQGGEGGSGPACLTCWQGWEAAVWKTGTPVDNYGMCAEASSTKMWELKKCACTKALSKGCEDVCNVGNVHPTEAQIDACSTAASLFCADAHTACQQAP